MITPMHAMVLDRVPGRLHAARLPVPAPGVGEVRLRVETCAVCRTDLHILDGELPPHRLPLIPGHQVVGRVDAVGPKVTGLAPGVRAGIPWLGATCGRCDHCRAGRENLCDEARFTGYDRDGGFAEYVVADARFCFPVGELDPVTTAPLLCAGLIGYRTLRLAGDAERIGIYGFGAAAHIIAQVALAQGRRVYAFTRPGDATTQAFARTLGVTWAGGADSVPDDALDAALIFAPAGELVPAALRAVRKGGSVVCGGIHMSDIPALPYALLWGERTLRSVANLTRADAREFLALAATLPLRLQVTTYPLAEVQRALDDLRAGRFQGSAVLDLR
ncbi:MAG TPA: zinc-dependent alcohol dehydrogenase family protein [Longimicrobiales bacterium]|nr:zinc-dependent alcohol dehydrogenase family protein [Longimicrobiales bacterium]